MKVGIRSPGDRVGNITKPLSAVSCDFVVNPDGWAGCDIVIDDTPDRKMFLNVLHHSIPTVDRPLIFRMRGDPFWGIDRWIDSRLKQRVALGMLNHVDGCIALSPSQSVTFECETGIRPEVVPLSIDTGEWPESEHTDAELRCVTLTNCMYPKKIQPLIEWAGMVDTVLELNGGHWLIGGSGKFSGRLAYAVDALDNVTFTGRDIDAGMALEWANVMLHLSDFDSFGMAILEGAASGLPVITKKQPPFTEIRVPMIAVRGRYGLAAQLRNLTTPDVRERWGRNARVEVTHEYNHKRVGMMWLEALESYV